MTPGIQKHWTIRNTKNDANLLGSNIDGGLFWCVHIHERDTAPTVILRIYNEYYFVDNSVKCRTEVPRDFFFRYRTLSPQVHFDNKTPSVFRDIIAFSKLIIFLVCCGCDTSYIVSVHIQCQASIYTLSLSRAFMAGAASQAGDADSSRAPGLTSGLQGSVNVHRGALLLVPQWQCISSFVFYI